MRVPRVFFIWHWSGLGVSLNKATKNTITSKMAVFQWLPYPKIFRVRPVTMPPGPPDPPGGRPPPARVA